MGVFLLKWMKVHLWDKLKAEKLELKQYFLKVYLGKTTHFTVFSSNYIHICELWKPWISSAKHLISVLKLFNSKMAWNIVMKIILKSIHLKLMREVNAALVYNYNSFNFPRSHVAHEFKSFFNQIWCNFLDIEGHQSTQGWHSVTLTTFPVPFDILSNESYRIDRWSYKMSTRMLIVGLKNVEINGLPQNALSQIDGIFYKEVLLLKFFF